MMEWLLALGPVGAVAVYWTIYVRYRNTDKSHDFEGETLIDAREPVAEDHKIKTRTAITEQSISGDNSSYHRARVKRLNPTD